MRVKVLCVVLSVVLAVAGSSCSSHKGTSSLSSSHKTTSSQKKPLIRTQQSSSSTEARLKAEKDAEAKARAAAEEAERQRIAAQQKAQQENEEASRAARQEVEAAAAKAKAEAAAKAKAEAAAREAEAARNVIVKEEKVKIVETQAPEGYNGKFHIIIGSFKVLENARQLCQDAIKNEFLPSIMENEDGLYRVSVYSCGVEKTARDRIAEIRKQYPEYVGVWLLIEKQ